MNMSRYLLGWGLSLCVSTLLYGDESMSTQMQSVVDEVIELRQRYEHALEKNRACQQQITVQEETMSKISHEQGYDYKLFEKNRQRLNALEAENVALKKRPLSSCEDDKKKSAALSKEMDLIKQENQRLQSSAEILVEKNHSLLDQITKLKHASKGKPKTADDQQIETLHNELESRQKKYEQLQAKNTELTKAHEALILKVTALEAQLQTANTEPQSTLPTDDDKYAAIQRALETEKEKNIKLQESSRLIEENLYEKLATVQKELAALQKKSAFVSSSADCKPTKVITVCKDDNPFPELMMKEQKTVLPHETEVQIVIEVKKTPPVSACPDRITTEEGSVYRMNKEADIYDAPQGKVVDRWEEKTSFTSNVSQGEWIMITGYFVDRRWQKAQKEIWVKAEDTLKR